MFPTTTSIFWWLLIDCSRFGNNTLVSSSAAWRNWQPLQVLWRGIVEAVRATLGSFGSDSSKSTKFGPDIPYTIPFRFFEGAKKSDTRGRHIGKIQYGRQSLQPQVVFKQRKGVKWRVIPLFVGYLSRRVRFWSYLMDIKSGSPQTIRPPYNFRVFMCSYVQFYWQLSVKSLHH